MYEDNFLYRARCVDTHDSKEEKNIDSKNISPYIYIADIYGLQDGTLYSVLPVYNIPKFMLLDKSLNIDILHSLHFYLILIRFFFKDKELMRKKNEI